jgi:regulator of nonsense transcripts 2
MDASSQLARESKEDEEALRRVKRQELKALNTTSHLGTSEYPPWFTLRLFTQNIAPSKASLDTSLKRHTALIKRAKQSIGLEHRDQLLKDIDGLTLERYVDEIATAVIEGVARCKNDKDVWSATEVCPFLNSPIRNNEASGHLLGWPAVRDVQIICAVHRRLKPAFSPKIVPLLHHGLSPPPRVASGSAPPVPTEVQERETAARIARQRPLLRVCAELAMVGIIGDENTGRSGGEWIMKSIKDLVSTYFRGAESGSLAD